jgi:hypothetical protein
MFEIRFSAKNIRLYAFPAFEDAVFQCQKFIPTLLFFGGIAFALVGRSGMAYSTPLLLFACSFLLAFFGSKNVIQKNGNRGRSV